jgi:hypothetical protein
MTGKRTEFDECIRLARREHAFMLRCERLTFREMGLRLGVRAEAANSLFQLFVGDMNRAMRRTKLRFARQRDASQAWL